MSLSQRSSSSVRNLRAVFENHPSDGSVSPYRGRSPAGSAGGNSNTDQSPASSIRTRKVRSSFISVEPFDQLEGPESEPSFSKSRSRSSRMPSTSMLEDSGYSETNGTAMETNQFQSASVATPLVELVNSSDPQTLQGKENTAPSNPSDEMILPTREMQSEHLEKPVSSVEDQSAELRPADVTDTSAVSSGTAISNATDTVKVTGTKTVSSSSRLSEPTAASRARMTAKPQQKAATKTLASSFSIKAKSPTQTVQISSHLTQATASSAAKREPNPTDARQRSTSGTSKPISGSSHLMAPTAASKARQEPETSSPSSPKAAKIPAKISATSKKDGPSLIGATRTKAGVPASKEPVGSKRSSLTRSSNVDASRQANADVPPIKNISQPPSEDFLHRMTKPTASSSSRSHDKVETVLAPPSKQASSTSKVDSGSNAFKTSATKKSTTPPSSSTKPTSSYLDAQSSRSEQPVSTASEPKLGEDSASPNIPQASEAIVEEVRGLPSTEEEALAQDAGNAISMSSESRDIPKPETPSDTKAVPALTSQDSELANIEEWNAAALPRTPQNKHHDPFETSPIPTTEAKAVKSLEPGRRSMMETPELESTTIH